MKQTLEQIVKDAYERGRLDEEMKVNSDPPLFTKSAAATIRNTAEPDLLKAKYIPDGSIVELSDGRLGVFYAMWWRKGYRMVKVSEKLGIEVRAESEIHFLKYPPQVAG